MMSMSVNPGITPWGSVSTLQTKTGEPTTSTPLSATEQAVSNAGQRNYIPPATPTENTTAYLIVQRAADRDGNGMTGQELSAQINRYQVALANTQQTLAMAKLENRSADEIKAIESRIRTLQHYEAVAQRIGQHFDRLDQEISADGKVTYNEIQAVADKVLEAGNNNVSRLSDQDLATAPGSYAEPDITLLKPSPIGFTERTELLRYFAIVSDRNGSGVRDGGATVDELSHQNNTYQQRQKDTEALIQRVQSDYQITEELRQRELKILNGRLGWFQNAQAAVSRLINNFSAFDLDGDTRIQENELRVLSVRQDGDSRSITDADLGKAYIA